MNATWQCCPVCGGNGIRPQGFYDHPVGQPFGSTSTAMVTCQACNGRGIIPFPEPPNRFTLEATS